MENGEENGITLETDLLASQDDALLSDRYRSFLFTGFGRVLISRLVSFISLMVIARIVTREVQDQMILLSSSQTIVGVIALFGLSYALRRQAIASEKRRQVVSSAATISLVLGLPVTVLLNFMISLLASFLFFDVLLYTFACGLFFMVQLVYFIEDARLRSDRAALARTIYTVVSSFSIPFLFLLFQSLSGVLIAWIIAYLITLVFERKILNSFFRSMTWDFHTVWELFSYSFPVYFSAVFAIVVQRIDSFILFLLFSEGALSEYYWVLRIVMMIEEVFLILLVGMLPLLTKLHRDAKKEIYEERLQSILRLGLLIGTLMFGLAFVESHAIIVIILGPDFLGGLVIMNVLIIAYFIRIIRNILYPKLTAEGKRRYLLEHSFSGSLAKICLLFILYPFGGIGIAWVIVFQNVCLAIYNTYRSPKTMINVIFRLRFIFTVLFIGGVCLFLPLPTNFVEYILNGIFFLAIFGFTLLIFRPLTTSDVQMINRILGKHFSPLMPIIKLISHQN